MKKGFTLIELMVVIAVIGLLSSIVLPRFTDSTRAGKAAQVHSNLQNIQQAIEMFQVKEGHYPVYGTDIGSGDGLSDKMAEYYSKKRMPETPAGGTEISEDEVVRASVYNNFNENELEGGWLYNEEEGRLFARLEEDTYGQGNIWVTAYDIYEDGLSRKVYPGMTLVNNEARWFSMDTFENADVETSFTIDGAGRMEIFLEGPNGDGDIDGYRLRIHPVMNKILLVKGSEENETKVEIVSKEEMTKQGITLGTWYDNEKDPNQVPIKMDISNGKDGSKSLSLVIDGKPISFTVSDSTISDSIKYTPSNESSQIGFGNKLDSGRELIVGDISVVSK